MKDGILNRVHLRVARDRLLDDPGSHCASGAAATAPTGVLRERKGEEGDHWCSYCHPQEREKGATRKVQFLRDNALQDEVKPEPGRNHCQGMEDNAERTAWKNRAHAAPASVLRERKGEEGDHWCSYCHPQEREKGATRKVQFLRDNALQDEVVSCSCLCLTQYWPESEDHSPFGVAQAVKPVPDRRVGLQALLFQP